MKILLLNENPVVSKLVSLSAKKMSYEFEELNAYDENLGHYDIIVVDSDTLVPLKILKEKCDRLIFLASRNQNIEVEAQILQKPFLPTDFLNLLNEKPVSDNIANLEKAYINSKNPYDEISLDLDNLSLEGLADENLDNKNLNESVENSENLSLENESDLSLDDLNFDENLEENSNETKENLEENKDLQDLDENDLKDLNEEDLKLSDENLKSESSSLEFDEISNESELKDLKSDEGELLEPKETEKELEISNESAKEEKFDDLPVVEEQEKSVDFDDIPEDAEFLGQEKDKAESVEFNPVVEEDLQDESENLNSNLSAQEQIKDELAQLDELETNETSDESSKVLENFKEEPILSENEFGTEKEELVLPDISDFNDLSEEDIKEALGEVSKAKETKVTSTQSNANDEIVNELSQSIAGAITSSIKDETLKAALKGMNMNININISFNEDKH